MPRMNVRGWNNVKCDNMDLINLYDCEIGRNCRIGAFVEIGRDVYIGRDCKIQTGAYLPERVTIGDCVFVGPHVVFCNVKYPMTGEEYGHTLVHDFAVIGANATILPGLIIGRSSIVGAGATVTKDVPAYATIKGIY